MYEVEIPAKRPSLIIKGPWTQDKKYNIELTFDSGVKETISTSPVYHDDLNIYYLELPLTDKLLKIICNASSVTYVVGDFTESVSLSEFSENFFNSDYFDSACGGIMH